MRKNIKLFINNQEVDLSQNISLPMTYTVEDFSNPTIVKNSFSKTITIPGTKNNNKIFGEIYKLDRFIRDHTGTPSLGVQFDPSKRVDFQIFDNAFLVESGYAQLNNISIKKNIINYNITLYGGLGDFFYNLMYDEEGEKKSLASLRYFIEDLQGNVLPADKEFDFRITKELVSQCFNYMGNIGNQLYNYLSFVPSYNGIYEDFDSEHCLINTHNSNLFPKSISEGGVTYSTYNGYGLAELNKSYTEWEMRDLRSYYQRPAIRMQKLLETMFRPENNGGYTINLDPEFFNDKNPYWTDTYMALPLFNSSSDSETTFINGDLINATTSVTNYRVGRTYGGEEITTSSGNTGTNSEEISYDAGTYDFTDLPANAKLNFQYNAEFEAVVNRSFGTYNELHIGYVGKFGASTNGTPRNLGWFTAVLKAYDAETGEELAKSDQYFFTDPGLAKNTVQVKGTPQYVYFKKTSTGNFLRTESGSSYFPLVIQMNKLANKINLKVELEWPHNYDGTSLLIYACGMLCNSDVLPFYDEYGRDLLRETTLTGINYAHIIVKPTKDSYISIEQPSEVVSNTLITKRKLLRTEDTPTDYLLSYCKLFGLYFLKDIHSKTIDIVTRNTFFNNIVNDWSDRIDWSKDLTVNPLLFDKKWYIMSLDGPETYYSKKYETEYNIKYGQQRLDTGYNFNGESNELYSDNKYENVISCRDTSRYYRNYFNNSNRLVPSFLVDNINYTLYNGVGTDDQKESSIDIYGANNIQLSKTADWYIKSGYDVMSKTCFYTLDNNEQSLSDISTTLLFWNGNKTLKDVKGNNIYYWITDDIAEMSVLNEDPCYIYTEDEYDVTGARIAIRTNVIPQFTRYMLNDTYVINSLDFGLPREAYIDDLEYNETSTIYYKAWKQFYNDQLNVNTKKVTCFVKLMDLQVSYDMLRQFYYFNDAIWILNKIESYDINSDGTTRCEFIKVKDMNSYLKGVQPFSQYVNISPKEATVSYNAGTISLEVESNVPWRVFWYNQTKITSITPNTGNPGVTTVNISYTENDEYDQTQFYARFTPQNEVDGPAFDIYQLPNSDTTVLISGNITDSMGGIPSEVVEIQASNSDFINNAYMKDDGTYRIYAPKNKSFTFEVLIGSEPVVTETLTLNGDTIKNITI